MRFEDLLVVLPDAEHPRPRQPVPVRVGHHLVGGRAGAGVSAVPAQGVDVVRYADDQDDHRQHQGGDEHGLPGPSHESGGPDHAHTRFGQGHQRRLPASEGDGEQGTDDHQDHRDQDREIPCRRLSQNRLRHRRAAQVSPMVAGYRFLQETSSSPLESSAITRGVDRCVDGCGPSVRRHQDSVVQAQGDDFLMTDGPYVEGKEHLGGFTIIEAPDLDVALEWGRKLARAIRLLPIEVRPFHDQA